MTRIWELITTPNRYLAVQQLDLRYFDNRFDGRPMAGGWVTPEYEILNKSKPVADFTSWQIGSWTFLVSDRAKEEVADLCGDDVEFLRFDVVKGKTLHAVNVLRREDFLDLALTEFMPGAGTVKRAAFRQALPRSIPPIFKVVGGRETYVSEAFGRMLVSTNKLTGARLRDPAKWVYQQIRLGEELNDFPGL